MAGNLKTKRSAPSSQVESIHAQMAQKFIFSKILRLLQKSANLTTGQRKKMPVESHPTK